jgi:hypothetical protein
VATAAEDRLNIRAQSVHFFAESSATPKVRVLINARIAAGLRVYQQMLPYRSEATAIVYDFATFSRYSIEVFCPKDC